MTYLHNRDFFLEVSKGNIPGHSYVHKFGENFDVDTGSTPEDIWTEGGTYNWMAVAQTVDVVSNSGTDDQAGTGAHEVTLSGLDSSWNAQTEVLALHPTDGTIAVTSASTWIRLDRMWVSASGSNDQNNGTLTATGNTSGVVHAAIHQNSTTGSDGQSQMAVYTVPNGKTAYLHKMYAAHERGGGNVVANVCLWQRQDADTSDRTWRKVLPVGFHSAGSSPFELTYKAPAMFAGKTDLRMRAQYASSTNLDIMAGFDLILVDD